MELLNKIKLNPKNPRTIAKDDFERLKKSIREFPKMLELRPIVYDENLIALGGNQRLKAVRELVEQEGFEVKAEYFKSADKLTEDEKRAFVIKDNIPNGNWDTDMLSKEWADLPLDEWGLDISGWNKKPEEDEPPEPSAGPAVSKLGEVYQLGTHRLMCGDSTIMDDVKKLMNNTVANMIFTDPPWNVAIGLDSNPRHRQREGLINDNLGEGFFAFLAKMSEMVNVFCSGDIYCVMGCEEWPNIHKALTEAGLHWSSTIVWVKDIFVLGRSKYHRRYEPIWYGWKDKSSFAADRKQDDVWEIDRPKRSAEHPTMKPVSLVARAIVNSSQTNDSVLDLFGGSGSTLIACEQMKRQCYIMEFDPKYADVIRKRYWRFVNNDNEEGWETNTIAI